MKALFIGGTGTISTEVTKLFVKQGGELCVLNRGNHNGDLPQGVQVLIGDIHDEGSIQTLLQGQTFDVVVDFIAFTEEEVERDYRLFAGKTKQYIFISSASAYQKPCLGTPITESTPLCNPYWQYSRDKIDLNGSNRLVMTFKEKKSDNQLRPVEWAFGRRSCFHCTNAGCVTVCPTGCLKYEENGVVSVSPEKCIGCRYCEMACPFDVPRYYGDEPKIDKCTMCWDRLENGMLPACVKTCQPGALHFGPRDEMIKLGKERVEFLKSRGYDKAELYGENECGGLHILQVCKFGAEAQGLVKGAQPSPLATLSKLAQPGAGLAAAATVAGLAVSFVAALGYRRRKMTIEEAKEHWTPAQRKRGEEYLREAKKEAAEQERRENAE